MLAAILVVLVVAVIAALGALCVWLAIRAMANAWDESDDVS